MHRYNKWVATDDLEESIFARKQDSPQGMDTFERTLAHDNHLVRGCVLGNLGDACLMQPKLQQEVRPPQCSIADQRGPAFLTLHATGWSVLPSGGARGRSAVPHAARHQLCTSSTALQPLLFGRPAQSRHVA